jgi:hypothetical protein
MILSNQTNKAKHVPILGVFLPKRPMVHDMSAGGYIKKDIFEYDFGNFSIIFIDDTFYITSGNTSAIDTTHMIILDELLVTDIVNAFLERGASSS